MYVTDYEYIFVLQTVGLPTCIICCRIPIFRPIMVERALKFNSLVIHLIFWARACSDIVTKLICI